MFAIAEDVASADEEMAFAPIDAMSMAVGAIQLEQLRRIANVAADRDWERWGARNDAHWLAMRMGISSWRASRLIRAAAALRELPKISKALSSGRLDLDKVLELARFARPDDEAELIAWARSQTPVTIRREGERRARQDAEEVERIERDRSVRWWYQEGTFGLEAYLPAAQGATVAKALERVAGDLPTMPGEEADRVERRHADALVALCAGRLSSDPDPDRASVVMHARLEDLRDGGANAEIEGGGVVPPEAVERLLCDARIQTIVEDKGDAVAVRSMRREPPAWMVRQVRFRDRTCRFPGCEGRRYTQAHHIRSWSQGGRTELPNLVLLCGFHHRLVHEHGWSLRRAADGEVRWFWPDGRPHRPMDSPEQEEERARSRHLRETAERFGFIVSDRSVESRVIPGIGPGSRRRRPAGAARLRLLGEARSGSPP